MTAKTEKTYYELTEHNGGQIVIFIGMIAMIIIICFYFALPLMQYFFEKFLKGFVNNETGKFISYQINNLEPKEGLSYLFSWAVDIYKGTPEEIRYWFNPVQSLIIPIVVLSFFMSSVISAVLPRKIGFLRQKIDREIANTISKISYIKYGSDSQHDFKEILNEIKNADFKDLHFFVEDWNMTFDDVLALQKAIKWRDYPFLKRLFHVNDGIQMYMRFYFTVKYSNTVLGFVYMGAAVLIIIIGLRGLKFIPPTQPSLVLFALGLEFTLLITYAVTLMYTKQEDDNELESKVGGMNTDSLLLSNEFGSSKDIEKLLRVFIKTKKPFNKVK
ncbi:hypothetical protein D9V86_11745 [Bacteroidetes/Chlorobi group bacterium ChocPot_Mid]|jgi:hypothetical protein|nr:MAG: hypothetical protein D9V86_11745 [Bacteroidetes/Chlorobi group bacterium ChocPot_Mid]